MTIDITLLYYVSLRRRFDIPSRTADRHANTRAVAVDRFSGDDFFLLSRIAEP